MAAIVFRFLVILMTSHLLGLNDLQSFSHCCSLPRSSFRNLLDLAVMYRLYLPVKEGIICRESGDGVDLL